MAIIKTLFGTPGEGSELEGFAMRPWWLVGT